MHADRRTKRLSNNIFQFCKNYNKLGWMITSECVQAQSEKMTRAYKHVIVAAYDLTLHP